MIGTYIELCGKAAALFRAHLESIREDAPVVNIFEVSAYKNMNDFGGRSSHLLQMEKLRPGKEGNHVDIAKCSRGSTLASRPVCV